MKLGRTYPNLFKPELINFSLRLLSETEASHDDTTDRNSLKYDELAHDRILYQDTTPIESAGFLSRIFFLWVNPLIKVSFTTKFEIYKVHQNPEIGVRLPWKTI